jgi:hypothetical protein
MKRFLPRPDIIVLALLVGASSTVTAQSAPRRSQHGSVSQRVGDTRITIEYNRPVARGRDLFGALVPYGRVWHPGADTASSITVSTDITVNGAALPAGTYTLWTEPNEGSWTFIFSKGHPAWHTQYPQGQDALRLAVAPRKGEHMETLSFYFPVVDGRKAELVFHWGTVVVPLAIEVP